MTSRTPTTVSTPRRLLGIALLVAVAIPGVRTIVEGGEAADGFPLSTYPMFSRDRGRVVTVPAVVVATPDGVERLSPSAIADTDQVIEANRVVSRAIRSGTADELCAEVAGRVEPGADDTVEVVLERYDSIEWAAGDEEPLAREVVATCR